jgi:hypothetical protein
LNAIQRFIQVLNNLDGRQRRQNSRHWDSPVTNCVPIISRLPVRVLPAPPRSPAQLQFPGAVEIVFNIPRLCRRRRGTGRSLSTGIGRCRRRRCRGLWPRQLFPGGILAGEQRLVRMSAETGSAAHIFRGNAGLLRGRPAQPLRRLFPVPLAFKQRHAGLETGCRNSILRTACSLPQRHPGSISPGSRT